ncbi:predicted protein [Lichtheimia corymbifera JMRC:FSU:9682]|uniref:Uncharacterized protein n=1 Tax=Lichtheimia corymbifera JMRC:FSU:9682 TaxID=1263082 RepID=A0A068SFX4_9FUNG|nr:predicted protein [Lichtheimia corymbifera JMRC:FSU:9682]
MALSVNEPKPPQAGTSSAMGAISSPSTSNDTSPNSNNNDSQRTPFEFWQSFSHHARHVQARKEVIYEDKEGKDAANRRRSRTHLCSVHGIR